MRRMLKETPSQTAGPFVHLGCTPSIADANAFNKAWDPGARMITGNPDGERIRLSITVHDGAGDALTDGMIEIWQPGPTGNYGPTDGFCHWGRQAMHQASGLTQFDTLKPGAPEPQSPHFLVWIVARGINLGLMTRIYLPDTDNQHDMVFILSGTRCKTLVAHSVEGGYHHHIYLQGTQETVFFNV